MKNLTIIIESAPSRILNRMDLRLLVKEHLAKITKQITPFLFFALINTINFSYWCKYMHTYRDSVSSVCHGHAASNKGKSVGLVSDMENVNFFTRADLFNPKLYPKAC